MLRNLNTKSAKNHIEARRRLLCALVKEVMKERNISFDQLAEAMGVSATFVRATLTGNRNFNIAFIYKIEHAMDEEFVSPINLIMEERRYVRIGKIMAEAVMLSK